MIWPLWQLGMVLLHAALRKPQRPTRAANCTDITSEDSTPYAVRLVNRQSAPEADFAGPCTSPTGIEGMAKGVGRLFCEQSRPTRPVGFVCCCPSSTHHGNPSPKKLLGALWTRGTRGRWSIVTFAQSGFAHAPNFRSVCLGVLLHHECSRPAGRCRRAGQEALKSGCRPHQHPLSVQLQRGHRPVEDGSQTYLNFQPVIPFSLNEDWNVISRTILPVVYQDNVLRAQAASSASATLRRASFSLPSSRITAWSGVLAQLSASRPLPMTF